ncbi:cytochrome c biogenesis heme-transporting ATPase CcmA [Aquabacterium sp.]|uniref:cytochrome c biogenesis heme-transporting ATPase CcmA n=1 Tax=Aquabacterium sp. TaxID=1872578 RepID=UPI0040379400
MTLQASQLAYARGNRKLFEGIDFEVGSGEALRIAGRNGSGKTSLLRLLCGLAQPLKGEVRWHGQSIHRHREGLHQALSYVGHAPGLKDDLSAWENVQFNAVLAGQACTKQQALDALTQLGLQAKAQLPARVLSQGQRRRVLLARLALPHTLSGAPRLLVLDEPFVALDQESVQVLATLLNQQLAQGATLVYTTHQPQRLQAAQHHELTLGEPLAQQVVHPAEAF